MTMKNFLPHTHKSRKLHPWILTILKMGEETLPDFNKHVKFIGSAADILPIGFGYTPNDVDIVIDINNFNVINIVRNIKDNLDFTLHINTFPTEIFENLDKYLSYLYRGQVIVHEGIAHLTNHHHLETHQYIFNPKSIHVFPQAKLPTFLKPHSTDFYTGLLGAIYSHSLNDDNDESNELILTGMISLFEHKLNKLKRLFSKYSIECESDSIFIGGGALRDIMLNRDIGDYDIFIYDRELFDRIVNDFSNDYEFITTSLPLDHNKNSGVFISSFRHLFENKKIDIIHYSTDKAPLDTINKFDFSCNAIMFSLATGDIVVASEVQTAMRYTQLLSVGVAKLLPDFAARSRDDRFEARLNIIRYVIKLEISQPDMDRAGEFISSYKKFFGGSKI